MKLISKQIEESIFYQLQVNLRTAEEVYKAAIYGAIHNEVQILQILKKTGLESSEQTLEKEKYKKAVTAINALSENEKLWDFYIYYLVSLIIEMFLIIIILLYNCLKKKK